MYTLHIVANLCERCIIGAVCHVKRYDLWAYRLRSPNGGGGDRPRPFVYIAIGAGSRIAEIPLRGLTSPVALVLCIHTGVSELLGFGEWGSLLSPEERHSLRLENGPELLQQGKSRYCFCVSQTTAVCEAGVG